MITEFKLPVKFPDAPFNRKDFSRWPSDITTLQNATLPEPNICRSDLTPYLREISTERTMEGVILGYKVKDYSRVETRASDTTTDQTSPLFQDVLVGVASYSLDHIIFSDQGE